LSAGFGLRLRPLTLLRPKPVLEVAGKPIIYFLIKQLENIGIKDIIINLHYEPSEVSRALAGFSFKSRLHFVYEKNILGTAGGLANAINKYHIKSQSMIVIHGD